MKFIVAGLGNIGAEYANTRHNIGFMVADELASRHHAEFTTEKHASIASCKIKGKTVILLKPTTYMNLSGKALNYWMQAEKVDVQQIIVISDDIAIPFSKIRLRAKGTHAGHNGLRNIEEVLKTSEYPRLRCGIGDDYSKGRQVEFVLGEFSHEEQKELPFFIGKAADAVESFIFAGISQTMTAYNR